LLLAQARLHDTMAFTGATVALGTNPHANPVVSPGERATQLYRQVLLTLDASNVEALSCLAAQSFYNDMPELSLKHYRRLLQMGLGSYSCELWNNLGLTCFHSGQYDMSLGCFDRALALLPSSSSASDSSASDSLASDIWYNLSLVGVSLGDLGLAYQACRVSVSLEPNNSEAYTNLGVLEMRKGNAEAAKANFATAIRLSGGVLYEPLYNGSLLAYKSGDFAEAFTLAQQAVQANPASHDSQELLKTLKQTLIQQ
jgi:tetratricopeptide repeat protein 8